MAKGPGVAKTARNTWKAAERRAAALFGARRNVGSGTMGRGDVQSASDAVHPRLFLEVKLRASCAVRALYDATRELAEKEGKTPVLALFKKHHPGCLIVVHSDDLGAMLEEYREHGAPGIPEPPAE